MLRIQESISHITCSVTFISWINVWQYFAISAWQTTRQISIKRGSDFLLNQIEFSIFRYFVTASMTTF